MKGNQQVAASTKIAFLFPLVYTVIHPHSLDVKLCNLLKIYTMKQAFLAAVITGVIAGAVLLYITNRTANR